MDWRLVATLVPGSIAGAYVGARTMMKVPARQLRLLFGAFLLFIAFRQLVWRFSAGASHGGAEGLLGCPTIYSAIRAQRATLLEQKI